MTSCHSGRGKNVDVSVDSPRFSITSRDKGGGGNDMEEVTFIWEIS